MIKAEKVLFIHEYNGLLFSSEIAINQSVYHLCIEDKFGVAPKYVLPSQ